MTNEKLERRRARYAALRNIVFVLGVGIFVLWMLSPITGVATPGGMIMGAILGMLVYIVIITDAGVDQIRAKIQEGINARCEAGIQQLHTKVDSTLKLLPNSASLEQARKESEAAAKKFEELQAEFNETIDRLIEADKGAKTAAQELEEKREQLRKFIARLSAANEDL